MTLALYALQTIVPSPPDVIQAVDQITDFLLKYAAALAAVGALAMVIVETGKKILDSRTRFQCLRWIRWLKRSDVFPVPESTNEPADVRTAALTDLLALCTAISRDEAQQAAQFLMAKNGRLPFYHGWRQPQPEHALFALELDRMMGSIQEAADIALTAPRRYPSLYYTITSGANRDDVAKWLEQAESGMAELGNAEPTPEQRQKIKDLAERLARLRQFTKRKLDGFQLYTGASWATHNQFWANIAGVVVMAAVMFSLRDTNPTSLPALIVLSLLGGVLSPLAKDLVSALKRVKDG